MNRKTLVSATLVLALGAFAVGGWLVSQQDNSQPQLSMENQASEAVSKSNEVDGLIQEALVRPYSPIMGPEDAPVTIVEFFDPACEACRAFYPILKEIMSEYPEEVKVVVRYTAFHGEGSELAILILEAARLQNIFVPVKEALLNNQDEWASHGAPDTRKILQIAADAGLNMEEALTQIKSPSIVGILNQDKADVQTVGVRQTPTFFVDGKPLVEFGAKQLIAQVRAAVEQSREASK